WTWKYFRGILSWGNLRPNPAFTKWWGVKGPRKLLNPVKSSRSHQELHRELMTSCKRGGGVRVESNKPELERVLECRRRDQLIKERKKQEEARRKISPLEAELRKRHQLEQQKDERDKLAAPEFVKVKENLRRTSYAGKEEKQV
uniref:Actin-associated protein FAM107A n=1 Tax=Hippocampus comes TaxID=109280 RepID=A0A3Q2YEJ7_HIPCM